MLFSAFLLVLELLDDVNSEVETNDVLGEGDVVTFYQCSKLLHLLEFNRSRDYIKATLTLYFSDE